MFITYIYNNASVRIMYGYCDGHGGIYTTDGELWGYDDGSPAGRRLIIFNTNNTENIYDDIIIYTI